MLFGIYEIEDQNVKLGLQYRYQQDKVQVNYNRFLGYTKDEDGNLIIEPEGAKVVKRIFREYLEVESLAGICKSLMRDGIYTAAENPTWRPETVQKILQNEKYIGDALLQKTYTVDFLTKRRLRMTASFQSIMFRIVTRLSFQENYICRRGRNETQKSFV